MEAILFELLSRLERLGEAHEELYDSEAREEIGNIIMDGFIRRKPEFAIPTRLGMLSDAADAEVRQALRSYIENANILAQELGLTSFHARLAAIQNRNVRTNPTTAADYEELFGHTPPECYDEAGNVLWDRVK